MGPRSDNRGYGLRTAGMQRLHCLASMGPRSDNRGYAGRWRVDSLPMAGLQWVHGPITVVMAIDGRRVLVTW